MIKDTGSLIEMKGGGLDMSISYENGMFHFKGGQFTKPNTFQCIFFSASHEKVTQLKNIIETALDIVNKSVKAEVVNINE